MFHIIVAAARPLTLKEMNIALAIEDHHRSYDDLKPDLDDNERFETSVRNLCGLFVTVVDQKVYLIHQTAKEFLLAKNEVASGEWKHSLIPMESEILMARICLTYLSFTELDGATDQLSTAVEYSYLDYAASSWATHYRRVQNSATEQMLQSVFRICDTHSKRFMTWFHVYWELAYQWSEPPQFTSNLMVGSYFGHHTTVKLLLKAKSDVESKDDYGRTPLSWAAENGYEAVVKLLLATGLVDVDSRDKYGRTPLSYAAENGYELVVKLLLATGLVDVNQKDGDYGRTPLSWAAGNGYEAVVKLLLATGLVDIDSRDKYGRTPLSCAAESGYENGNHGRTLLAHAAVNGHGAVIKVLLGSGQADVGSKDKYDQTPLEHASQNGHKDVITLLQSFSSV